MRINSDNAFVSGSENGLRPALYGEHGSFDAPTSVQNAYSIFFATRQHLKESKKFHFGHTVQYLHDENQNFDSHRSLHKIYDLSLADVFSSKSDPMSQTI